MTNLNKNPLKKYADRTKEHFVSVNLHNEMSLRPVKHALYEQSTSFEN